MRKFSSNPRTYGLNWDVYISEGVKKGRSKAKWTTLLAGLTLLMGTLSGFGQLQVDTLYCQLQTRLEVGATLNSRKLNEAASDTLQALLPTIPLNKGLAFRRLLADFHFQIGYAAYYQGDTALAKSSLSIADSILETIDRQGSELRARILRQRGMVAYFMSEDGFRAKELYESAYREWLLIPQKDSVELAIVLQCMGQAATRLGEYSSAIDLYQQSLSMRERIFGKLHPRVGFAYWNLGNAYAYSDEYENAAQAYQEALEIMRASDPANKAAIADLTRNLGATFSELGCHQEAIVHHQDAVAIWRTLHPPFAAELIDCLTNMAMAYAYNGQFSEAQKVLKEVEFICKRHSMERGEKVAFLRLTSARMLELLRAPVEDVLFEFQSAMLAIAPNENLKDWRSYPEVSATPNPLLLQQIVLEKSRFLSAISIHDQRQPAFLEVGLRGYETAALLTDRLRNEYQDQDDKLFLSGRGSLFLHDALRTVNSLHLTTKDPTYIARAFKLMENCKFQLLLEFFRKSHVQFTDEIDPKTVLRLDDFRRRCTELDYQLAMSNESDDSFQHYQSELLKIRLQLNALEDSLSLQSRIFKTVNPSQSTIPLDSFLQLLPKHCAALSYALTDSSIFVIQASNSGVSFRQTRTPSDFEDSLTLWIGLCRKPLEDKADIRSFGRLGNALYQILMAPELDKLQDVQQLLIIPDGILGSLPFDALLTAAPKPESKNLSNFPYLVRKMRCSFAASATLWADQLQFPFEKKALECLGIAWGKDAINTLGGKPFNINGLQGTESELDAIRQVTSGKFLIGKDASEAVFKQIAPQYSILHLALHARATEADPQILFPNAGSDSQDGILHFHELFQLHLNARLAVLSACETGSGKLIKGEGIQSISSGFAAVGVPSLIISLWELDDEAGLKVMRGFYEGIQAGIPLDQALQQSKLAFLKNATGDKCAPYYWSAFVPMGNMKPILLSSPPPNPWWLAGLAGIVSLCIFAAYRIYFRKRTLA